MNYKLVKAWDRCDPENFVIGYLIDTHREGTDMQCNQVCLEPFGFSDAYIYYDLIKELPDDLVNLLIEY